MPEVSSIETQHPGGVIDAKLDYYGRRLATAGVDGIQVWEVENPGSVAKLALLAGESDVSLRLANVHTAAVQQISWGHPSQGSLLLSCAHDGLVALYSEVKAKEFIVAWHEKMEGMVNSVQFGPHEFGVLFAAGSSSGLVQVWSQEGEEFRKQGPALKAHAGGVNAISWAPATSPATLASGPAVHQYLMPSLAPRKFATGGNDNNVKIWRYASEEKKWIEETTLGIPPKLPPTEDDIGKTPEPTEATTSHGDWVRDVAWRPNVGIPSSSIAAACEDGTCGIWTQDMEGQPWVKKAEIIVGVPVWRCSWSATGLALSLSVGDQGKVHVYKEDLESKQWVLLTDDLNGS